VSKHKQKPTARAKRFPRLTLTTVLVATVILAIAAVAVASRQKAKATGASEAERSLRVANKSNFIKVKVAGQDVEVDSQTGRMRELTDDEARKLAAGLKQMVNKSTDGLSEVQHADGSVTMDLQDRFQNVLVARVNDDRSVSQSCVDNPDAAGAFFGIDPKLIEDPTMTTPIRKQSIPQVLKDQK
jgi:hypothetical protein